MTVRIAEYAMTYAKKGFHVFPCHVIEDNGYCSCGKVKCPSPGKHPQTNRGHKEATTDIDTIKQWWLQYPDANIGLNLEKSGLIAIDIDCHDGKADGRVEFNKLLNGRTLPTTPKAITGSGGQHIIFKKPEGEIKGLLCAGVDIKYKGYIIVEPSVHPNGKAYQWAEGESLLEIPSADCPDWLVKDIVKLPSQSKKKSSSSSNKNKNDTYPASYGEQIIQRCAFLKHFSEEAENLSEPEWYQGIGVLSYTEGSHELIHEFSSKHPTYNRIETEKKIAQWREASEGPATCDSIYEKCFDECKRCPYYGKISSPITLGYGSNASFLTEYIQPFPVNALPTALKNFAIEASNAIQCPIDYVACSLLAMFSLIIGGNKQIQIEPEWIQTASLWLCLVGRPSSKKSPAISIVFRLLSTLEDKLLNEHKQASLVYDNQLEEHKIELEQWKKAKKSDDKNAIGSPPIKPTKPKLKRLTTSDTTVEALCFLLAENTDGLALSLDELDTWLSSLNQYKGGKGSDRSHYLSIWSNGRITVDRKGKEPIIVPSPFLTIIGGIQPDVLKNIDSQSTHDGMKERILYSIPEPNKEMPKTGSRISEGTRRGIIQTIEELYDSRSVEVIYKLSPEAQEVFLSIKVEWHHKINSEGFPEELEAYYVKMKNYLGRFALILHHIKQYTDPSSNNEVTPKTLSEAKEFCDYFLAHAERAFGLIRKTNEEQQVDRAVNWIKNRLKKEGFKPIAPRDIQQSKIGPSKKVDYYRWILQQLPKYGYGYWDGKRLIFYIN